jgi:CRISPR system Cascade subunit CasE
MGYYFSRARLRRTVEMSAEDRNWLHRLSEGGEAYRDHALIWKLFRANGVPRDFVFRRETPRSGESKAALTYLVVSVRRPDGSSIFTVETKSYAPRIAAGEYLRFDLRANPVVSRKDGEKAYRHDVLMDAKKHDADPAELKDKMYSAALAWLMKRAPQWGLDVRPESVMMDGYSQQRLPDKGRRAGFSSLDYRGLATVADSELLLRALTAGVGHARSYGCGLLLVKRAE